VAAWLAKDPLPRYRERLVAEGASEAALDTIDSEAKDEVARAVEEAKAAPLADPASVEREVFADGSSRWRR
jgi:TPP-dependent pyruvate/acetoin dehydrogenase alpha subunit